MDRLSLTGIKLIGDHGALPEEKGTYVLFEIDVHLYTPLEEAGEKDSLDVAVDYREIYRVVVDSFQSKRYTLIEGLAEGISGGLLARFPKVRAVEVVVKKKNPLVGGEVNAAEVCIRRVR